MKDNSKNRGPIIFVVVVSLLGAMAIIWNGPPSSRFLQEQQLNHSIREVESGDTLREATKSDVVRRYINAYQVKNCTDLIESTWWIQERLEKIRSKDGVDETAIQTEIERLCEDLYDTSSNDTTVGIMGLSDQFLLSPVLTFKVIGGDPGRDDLAKPVAERVWVEIVYADPQTAPQLENNMSPVQSLIAGINVSEDNFILKGSVRGNWEIDFTSISTTW